MKTIGFPISHKENENRRAILPKHIKLLSHPNMMFFEKGYGLALGIEDQEYIDLGCNIVTRDNVLNCDIICDPKIGDADYLDLLHDNQIVFGWIHATQNRDITDKLVEKSLSAFAWEKMYDRGRHVFWRNNELAGEAAVMHAFQCYGMMPYDATVAVIGRGNTARGAIKILNMLGAKVTQYERKTEDLLKYELQQYDAVVNCVLWDVMREDHIITNDDLKYMKKGALIIDVSCDRNGGIESSVPTTINNPTYVRDGIMHYVVDHTPALFFKTFTSNNSEIVYPYIEELMCGKIDHVLSNALIIDEGNIVDPEIIEYQKR